MWEARLETRNFDFEAYGDSKEQARGFLVQALNRHGRQYKCVDGWYADSIDDIITREIKAGAAYRDREEI